MTQGKILLPLVYFADYTTDARTDNVVRIGTKTYDKRYTSTGSNGTLNLYAKGLIDLNVEE